ncbi:MAG: hypothetical protein ACMXYG_01415 [Candidatus Woesearchaeota archaeon]
MRVRFLLLVMFLFLVSSVFASIDISEMKDSYYIGESVRFNVAIDIDEDMYGFLAASLVCSDVELEYFRIPLFFDKDRRLTVEVEPLVISRSITKANFCNILLKVMNQDNRVISQKRSNRFNLVSGIELDIYVEKEVYEPGDSLFVNVFVNTLNNNFKKAKFDAVIDKKLISKDLLENEVTLVYELPNNMPSGRQKVFFEVRDDYGNIVTEELNIQIVQIPSKINNSFIRTNYYADRVEEEFVFRPILLDQSDIEIKSSYVMVTIVDPDNKTIVQDEILSNQNFTWKLVNTLKPGKYNIITQYEDVLSTSFINVLNKDFQPIVIEDSVIIEDSKELIVDDNKERFPLGEYLLFLFLCVLLLVLGYLLGRQKFKKHSKKKKDFWED